MNARIGCEWSCDASKLTSNNHMLEPLYKYSFNQHDTKNSYNLY